MRDEARRRHRSLLAAQLRSRLIENRRAAAARGDSPGSALADEVRQLVDEEAGLLAEEDREAVAAEILRERTTLDSGDQP